MLPLTRVNWLRGEKICYWTSLITRVGQAHCFSDSQFPHLQNWDDQTMCNFFPNSLWNSISKSFFSCKIEIDELQRTLERLFRGLQEVSVNRKCDIWNDLCNRLLAELTGDGNNRLVKRRGTKKSKISTLGSLYESLKSMGKENLRKIFYN